MDSSKVLVIVPRLPPSIDGVGDYSLGIVREMKRINQKNFEFLICDPLWKGPPTLEGFKIHKLEARTQKSLNSILSQYQSVFLNYVGYGYARRGSPVWLTRGLCEWKKKISGSKLTTMFHELYAFGPVWTSQFWTSPLQKYIAVKLMLISDHTVTSKEGYAKKIEKLSKGRHRGVLSLPVPSNVGEPIHLPTFSQRENAIVIFGSSVPRLRVYENSLRELSRVCKELRIEKIIDIGKDIPSCPDEIDGVPIIKKGILPNDEISRILTNSKVGFFNYPTEFLSKSGIFAAYTAHGVFPVGVSYANQAIDQVKSGEQYWLSDNGTAITAEIAERISLDAYTWYQGHRLSVQAAIFSNFF